MLNPNICKLVYCELIEWDAEQKIGIALYANTRLPVYTFGKQLKLGKRRLHLKFSITADRYYLTKS